MQKYVQSVQNNKLLIETELMGRDPLVQRNLSKRGECIVFLVPDYLLIQCVLFKFSQKLRALSITKILHIASLHSRAHFLRREALKTFVRNP